MWLSSEGRAKQSLQYGPLLRCVYLPCCDSLTLSTFSHLSDLESLRSNCASPMCRGAGNFKLSVHITLNITIVYKVETQRFTSSSDIPKVR